VANFWPLAAPYTEPFVYLLFLLLPLASLGSELSLPANLRFREPFLIGTVQAGVQTRALKSSRGSCRAILLSERKAGAIEKDASFEDARVEGIFHKILVAERYSFEHGRQELNVECLARLRDKTPLTEKEFLSLLRELGFRITG